MSELRDEPVWLAEGEVVGNLREEFLGGSCEGVLEGRTPWYHPRGRSGSSTICLAGTVICLGV